MKMSIIVIIIDDHADKLLLQRKKSKPNAMRADGKTIRPVMTVIRMMNTKGACQMCLHFPLHAKKFLIFAIQSV